MATSATEREGKSTTLANLAVALAQDGWKVVLCDLDARRPVVDRLFGLKGQSGLTDVALGTIELDRALQVVRIPQKPYWSPQGTPRLPSLHDKRRTRTRGSLEVLPLGMAPPDPGEFVGSDTVGDILRQLRARADVVLLDAPSLLGVGDAMTASGEVDGVLVVVRLHVIRRSSLIELRRVLDSWPVFKLGYVITGASLDDRERYSRYYRRQVLGEDERESVG
jgi:Mrp family chromosome partitioning ATPase